MIEFIRNNAVWLTPLMVAIVSGVFYLIKRGGVNKKQTIKNVRNSQINQTMD